MNIFLKNNTTNDYVEGVILGPDEDNDKLTVIELKNGTTMNGVINFTDYGTVTFMNIFKYDMWTVLAILPYGY